MSRFINWILTMVVVVAGGALIIDGLHPADIFDEDASVLLRIAAAVPAVVLAIRCHTARCNTAADARLAEYETRMRQTYAEMRAFIAEELAVTRADTRQALNELGDRLSRRTVETALGAMAHMVTEAKMEAADRAADRFRLTDTGPFRMPR